MCEIVISEDLKLEVFPALTRFSCAGCYFDSFVSCLNYKLYYELACTSATRKDGKDVIFKKVDV